MPPQPPEVRKTAPQIRKHRFHLRPQLIGTILLVIVAFSAGLAIGPYITPYRSIQNTVPMIVTVTTTVVTTPITSAGTSPQITSATVTQTSTTTTGQSPKWISSSTNVVSYLQAANYAGQSKIVEGKIFRTYASSKGTVFLDFHDPYQGYFEVTIFASDVKNFPFSPVSFYLNKEVRVTGTIEMYQGAPEIIVHSPSQIEVANMGFNYP
jgi:DNA/RNA endonuclease YhcR with UshA esterase domain